MRKTISFTSKIVCASSALLCGACGCSAIVKTLASESQEVVPEDEPKLWDLLDIEYKDEKNVILKGFKPDKTYDDINKTKEKVLIIPPDVTEIANYAFAYTFDGIVIKLVENIDFSQATKLKRIGVGAFYWNKGLEFKTRGKANIDLSATRVETIGDQAFASSNFDGKVVFPETLKKIGNNAFESCQQLNGDLIIPKGIESIGTSAFKDCTNISKLILSANDDGFIPDWLYNYSFCFKNLGVKQTGQEKPVCFIDTIKNTYDEWSSVLFDRQQLPDSMFEIKMIDAIPLNCFKFDQEDKTKITGFSSYNIGNYSNFELPKQNEDGADTTSIADHAFEGDAEYEDEDGNVVWRATTKKFYPLFPNDSAIKNIGQSAFNMAGNLRGPLVLPASITSIGEKAFRLCNNLTSVDLSALSGSVNTGNYAFYDCKNLKSAYLSPSLKPFDDPEEDDEKIGELLSDNEKLFWIDMSSFAEDPPTDWSDAFKLYEEYAGVYPRVLLLPEDAEMGDHKEGWIKFLIDNDYIKYDAGKEEWEYYPNWKVYKIANLDNELTTSLLNIYNHKLLSIKDKEDPEWDSIGSITIPSTVKEINDRVFEDFLKANPDGSPKYVLKLNDGLEKIGDYAFDNCDGIVFDGNYPNTLRSIGTRAFWRCKAITENFQLPPRLEYLGDTPWLETGARISSHIDIPKTLKHAGGDALGDLQITEKNPTFVLPASLKSMSCLQRDTHWEGPFYNVKVGKGSTSITFDVSAFDTIPGDWNTYCFSTKSDIKEIFLVQSGWKFYWETLLTYGRLEANSNWEVVEVS